MANKKTFGTRTQYSTFGTDLGSIVRLNSLKNNSFSFSFIPNEVLQLIETPITQPVIKSPSSPNISYAFKVFHNNLVSVKAGNNLFAYVVVNPLHKTVFSSRDFFKQSPAGMSAFALKFSFNMPVFPFDLLDFRGIEKLAVRSNSKVVYSDINTKNSLEVRAFDIDIFGKGKQEETSAFFIYPQKAFSNFPSEIFNITIRNFERDFNPAFDSSQTQNIIFERSRAREVISHTDFIDYWLGFSLLNHSTGLFDTSNSQLALQSPLSYGFIDKWVEFDVILNLSFPSLIYAELKGFSIDSDGSDYFRSCFDFDFCCCSNFHINIEDTLIYILYGQMSSAYGGKWQFLPRLKSWVSLPYDL